MTAVAIIGAIAVGIVIGFALGWWLSHSRTNVRDAGAQEQSHALQAGVAGIVEPLHATIDRLTDELHRSERARINSHAGLSEQVAGIRRTSHELTSHTQRLANALHTPYLRGRWGEMHLQKVVEAAGMSRHCDFTPQATTAPGKRPDLVVHLPGDRRIVVDAKVPLQAYLEAVSAPDTSAEQRHVADHARALRHHITALSDKQYWHGVHSPEFVVLFVPSDPILEAACRADDGLIDFAFERNIIPASPSTLMALLRTVALTWREEALAEDAQRIHELGRELLHRMNTMGSHFNKLATSLGKTVESYNATVATMESRVLVTARTLSSLDAFAGSGEHTPPSISSIDTQPRWVSAGNSG